MILPLFRPLYVERVSLKWNQAQRSIFIVGSLFKLFQRVHHQTYL